GIAIIRHDDLYAHVETAHSAELLGDLASLGHLGADLLHLIRSRGFDRSHVDLLVRLCTRMTAGLIAVYAAAGAGSMGDGSGWPAEPLGPVRYDNLPRSLS